MFRPYGFKSLVAWVAGSVAGNRAYYNTKKRQKLQDVSSQLADEYKAYQKSGGHLGVEDWLRQRCSVNNSAQETERFEQDLMRKVFGEFDSKLECELLDSLSILRRKIEGIERSVQNERCNKNVFEDIFIIAHGLDGFVAKYGNTISHVNVSRGMNIGDEYRRLLSRFDSGGRAALTQRPELWETVQTEMDKKFSNDPRLGIILATWEIAPI